MSPPRRTPSLRFGIVDRRQALQTLLGGAAAAALAACTRDGGDSGSATADPEEIPPLTPTGDFYVTSCCGTAEVDGDSWRLSIADEDGELAGIDLAGLQALDAREREHTLECIGSNPDYQGIGNALWRGLPLLEVLDHLGVSVPESAVELKFSSADGYTTSLPVGDLDAPLWLVWEMNGAPLTPAHGYPVRVLAPGRYGIKNPKWLLELRFVDQTYVGYWESLGWSNSAVYQPNTLVASPRYTLDFPAGPLRVLGTAFAGSDPVDRVELSLDGGESWQDCELDYAPGADVWTLWSFDWDATAGTWDIRVRCTTASGAQSVEDPGGTDRYLGYDGSMQVVVTIT